MPPVGLSLASFLRHKIERELIGGKFLCRLGDARSLQFEQVGQRAPFLFTPLLELGRNRRQSLGRDLLQGRDEVDDVLGDQTLDTRDPGARRFPGFPQGLCKLVEGLLLAAFAQRAEPLAITF